MTRSQYQWARAVVVSVMVLACGQQEDERQATAERSSQSVEPVTSPSHTADYEGYDLQELIDRLPGLEGDFTSETGFDFTGDASLLEAFRQHGDSAVAALVDCMDEPRPAMATWRGERLRVGHVCREALRRVAYYEYADDEGDISADWPGYVHFGGSIAELREAKRAWQAVVSAHSYVLLP